VRRVVILGRGGAGKSTLARQLGAVTGLSVTELDKLFWQPGLTAAEPAQWAARQQDLLLGDGWILDGDLGPYDSELDARLRAADTIIVLNYSLVRCAWRTLRRGREGADYWRWVLTYRWRGLPVIMSVIRRDAPEAKLWVLRRPGQARRLLDEIRQEAWRTPLPGRPGLPHPRSRRRGLPDRSAGDS
jgi:hypothetical protein